MATIRENIMLAVLAKLSAMSSLPASKVFRNRKTAITRGDSPALLLRKDNEPAPEVVNVHQRQLHFVIEIYVRGENGESDADPIEAEVHNKLMMDRTLGGKCTLLIAADTEYESADADLTAHRTIMRFNALYRVEPENLSLAA
jgi:hypothetical protein